MTIKVDPPLLLHPLLLLLHPVHDGLARHEVIQRVVVRVEALKVGRGFPENCKCARFGEVEERRF